MSLLSNIMLKIWCIYWRRSISSCSPVSNTSQIGIRRQGRVGLTSSTGAKYIPFSKAYRWNSLLPCMTTSRYRLSTGTVWESLCPA